jgi:glycosyltransferase involved in cell wall biosynthesis
MTKPYMNLLTSEPVSDSTVSSRLRILLVAPLIYKSAGGLSSYIAGVVPRLCDAGHQVTVVASDCTYRGAKAEDCIAIDPRAAVKLFRVRGRINRRLYRSSELKSWLRKSISQFDIVDIQGVWSWFAVDAACVCREAGVGYVLTPHGSMTRWDWAKQMRFKQVFFALKLRREWSEASVVRYLSRGELDNSMRFPESPSVIIPNAIESNREVDLDGAIGRVTRQRLGIGIDDPMVLFLGRVSVEKGVAELLEAFVEVRATCPQGHLVIVGPMEGKYGEMIRHKARTLGEGHIHILGPMFGDAKMGLFAAATLFATLSKSEGLSIAALEALSFGVPALITQESNLPEVEAGNAGRITSCTPAGAAGDLRSLLQDASCLRAMRTNARVVAQKHFSWQVVLPQLLNIYMHVAEHRPID